jgi:hypothetical protein
MKSRFALAALALGTTVMIPAAVAQESLDGKATITATQGKDGKVTVVLKGAESKDKIYVNKSYPIKCSLKAKDGGKLDKNEIKKDDLKFEDAAGKEGKANSATFSVAADKGIDGECKMVVCTDNACSSPFTVKFASAAAKK